MELIEAQNIQKIYENDGVRTVALKDATLTIKEGEFVAIVGPSGSGKSTLMQILGCLDRPTSGKYFFEGKELNTYTDIELAKVRNEKIGFVFQAFNLLPRLSVLENIAMPLVYAGFSEKKRIARAMDMIKLVDLEDRALYLTSRLSGGQKQRVAIARALVNEPKIIFADEPTGNLDSKSGEVVLDFLQKLNNEGHTIVIVTHETYVSQFAARSLLIKDGEIAHDKKMEGRRMISKDDFIR
jgi:putative ABC transport system ATP-binding protein